MFRKNYHLVGLVLLAVLAITPGCTPQEYKPVDKRQVDGNMVVQTMPVDNCLRDEALTQDMAVQQTFHHTVEITPQPGKTLDESELREKILTAYEIDRASEDKVCLLPVDVPARTRFEYDIEWTEIWREGTIETDPGGEQVGTYRILIDLGCQVVEMRAAECTNE